MNDIDPKPELSIVYKKIFSIVYSLFRGGLKTTIFLKNTFYMALFLERWIRQGYSKLGKNSWYGVNGGPNTKNEIRAPGFSIRAFYAHVRLVRVTIWTTCAYRSEGRHRSGDCIPCQSWDVFLESFLVSIVYAQTLVRYNKQVEVFSGIMNWE